jgi:hypothetical protein
MHHAKSLTIPGTPRVGAANNIDGSALFFSLGAAFIGLFAFVFWYCPRHL